MRYLLGLLVVGKLAAQPVPQLMGEFQHERALRRIETRLPQSAGGEREQLQLWRVECLLELDRTKQAEALLNTLPKEKPQFFLLRARLARALDHDDLARQDLEHLLSGPPGRESCEAALYLATLYAETGKIDECDRAFSRCMEIIDELPEAQLNWQKIYYQRGVQLEKAARLTQAIDWCRLGSRHCERVRPGSSAPLRSLEAILLGRLQHYEQADRVWSGLTDNSGTVKALVAWGYDMLYQRSDRQGILSWLKAAQKTLSGRLEPHTRLHLLLLKAQIQLYRLHEYAQAEATLKTAQPLAPNRPRAIPGGWRVTLRFHPYGPEPSSELEWVCWMRLESMQRRRAPESEIQEFMKSVAPALRPEERGPWLFQMNGGAEQALALSRGLQRSKLLASLLSKNQAQPDQWRESLAELTPKDQQKARDFLIETAADSAFRLNSNSPGLEQLGRQLVEPLELEEMITRLESRQDLNRLVPLLQRRIHQLFLEGRRGEAVASAYRLLAWGERDGQLNLQASALWDLARLDAAAGHWQQACDRMEKSRQLRIQAQERKSEEGAARSQIILLEWAGQSQQARQLADQYAMPIKTPDRPPPRPTKTPIRLEAAAFQASCSRLAVDYPQFTTSVAMLPSRMVELRPQLNSDQVLIQIFVAPQETVVLTAAREGFTFQRLLVSRELLEHWVQQLRHQLRSRPDSEVADALNGLLLQPLDLKDRKVTLVCPGLLQDLPWDFLQADWNCWWLWAGEAAHRYPAAAEPRVLALGDVPGLDLPATRQEIEQLAGLLPTQPLLGMEATRVALERLAPACEIVHLATHASLDRQPDRAQLALADGAYTARQVFACPLKPGALVVLSACDTANSRAQDRAPTTLANAFLAAGASQVVATLAPVEDEAARRFFTSFYTRLKAGLAPAEALQAAKREHQTDPDSTWAAFVLLGGCP